MNEEEGGAGRYTYPAATQQHHSAGALPSISNSQSTVGVNGGGGGGGGAHSARRSGSQINYNGGANGSPPDHRGRDGIHQIVSRFLERFR
jgi:hypothetical protein